MVVGNARFRVGLSCELITGKSRDSRDRELNNRRVRSLCTAISFRRIEWRSNCVMSNRSMWNRPRITFLLLFGFLFNKRRRCQRGTIQLTEDQACQNVPSLGKRSMPKQSRIFLPRADPRNSAKNHIIHQQPSPKQNNPQSTYFHLRTTFENLLSSSSSSS